MIFGGVKQFFQNSGFVRTAWPVSLAPSMLTSECVCQLCMCVSECVPVCVSVWLWGWVALGGKAG